MTNKKKIKGIRFRKEEIKQSFANGILVKRENLKESMKNYA